MLHHVITHNDRKLVEYSLSSWDSGHPDKDDNGSECHDGKHSPEETGPSVGNVLIDTDGRVNVDSVIGRHFGDLRIGLKIDSREYRVVPMRCEDQLHFRAAIYLFYKITIRRHRTTSSFRLGISSRFSTSCDNDL